MSTRAVYTVKDEDDEFHVYIHCDGYPSGAAAHIAKAVPYAWRLPRFEAMDWAAALIAGNKRAGDCDVSQGGKVYCTKHWNAHGDLAYRYEIQAIVDALHVTAYRRKWSMDAATYTQIFAGTLADFTKFAAKSKD